MLKKEENKDLPNKEKKINLVTEYYFTWSNHQEVGKCTKTYNIFVSSKNCELQGVGNMYTLLDFQVLSVCVIILGNLRLVHFHHFLDPGMFFHFV